MISTISVIRRPYRSAMSPKRNAPTGRIASVRKIASATAETFAWNCVAIALTQNVRIKKSNASSDQPKKQAINVFRCTGVSRRKWPTNSIAIPPLFRTPLESPANASIWVEIGHQKSTVDTFPMPELDSPQRQAPDSLMLTGFWYRALPADRVHRNQLHKAMLLEIPLVVGRDRAKRPFALRDACPHRGMTLHCGNFDGENIECSYHGWQFDAHNGQCQLIPSLTADQNLKVDRIYAGSYPCEEQDGFVWVYIPDDPRGDGRLGRLPEAKRGVTTTSGAGFARPEEAPDPAPEIEKFAGKYKLAYLTADMPVSIDHGIIGLMDPAHGPFVHQAWWWRSRHSIHEKEKKFEPIPNGFRMSPHTPSSNSAPYRMLQKYTGEPVSTTI